MEKQICNRSQKTSKLDPHGGAKESVLAEGNMIFLWRREGNESRGGTSGCKARGKVTFMEQRRADTSSPKLRKAKEVSLQYPRTAPLVALSVCLSACWSVWSLFWAS